MRYFFLIMIIILLPFTGVFGAPKSELWTYWETSNESSIITIDHTPWAQFLNKYLVTDNPDGIHMVKYSSVTEKDSEMLDRYIKELEKLKVIGLNKKEQKAYWINIYNALTVKVILDHYPVKSIRDISISSSRGPWDAKLLTIEGKEVSLNDIEHRILRPIYRDERVHYAVNCASLGCPNLSDEPYTARNMEDLLNEGAALYINHPRGIRIEGKRMVLSSIYKWFQQDFGSSEEEVMEHLLRYASSELGEEINKFNGKIKYEKRINSAPPTGKGTGRRIPHVCGAFLPGDRAELLIFRIKLQALSQHFSGETPQPGRVLRCFPELVT
jgi:hypothetical protein